jgi:hypothetical protein
MRAKTRISIGLTGFFVIIQASLLCPLIAAPGDSDEEAREIAAAVQRTAMVLRRNSGCPQDPAEFEKMVAALWPHLHPELAQRLREKDPAYVAARRTVMEAGLRAKEIAAERAKDPAFVAKRNAAEAALRKGAVDRRVAEERAIREAESVRARQAIGK